MTARTRWHPRIPGHGQTALRAGPVSREIVFRRYGRGRDDGADRAARPGSGQLAATASSPVQPGLDAVAFLPSMMPPERICPGQTRRKGAASTMTAESSNRPEGAGRPTAGPATMITVAPTG